MRIMGIIVRCLVGVAGIFSSLSLHAVEELRFISVTPQNTRLADGSLLPEKLESIGWKWLPEEGNQGILESYGDPSKNASPIVITAKELEPGRDYEVFGFFWSHGFGAAPAARDKEPHHWPARFGLGLATLTTLGGKLSPNIPWIICPESELSAAREYKVVLEEKEPLIKGVPDWTIAKDDLRLIRVRLGFSRAGKDGTLPVFADDFPDSKYCGRTQIDGIGVRITTIGSDAVSGAGIPNALHLALRTGDKLSVIRELAADADVNTLDSSGLSPLFHSASIGDQEMVTLLLSKGADPNLKGQSVLALTAAASIGDTAMVRLLLHGGAKVPSRMLDLRPWIKAPLTGRFGNEKFTDVSDLHPAIAAIRVGSLSTLKALLEKKPDLDLEALGQPVDGVNAQMTDANSLNLIEGAMAMGHDELAAFLIDRGCALRSHIFDRGSQYPDAVLLARSITEGKALERSRDALLRRKASVVVGYRQYGYELMPWDGLSAAISVGDVVLTKQFLKSASYTNLLDRNMLFAIARWSGNTEILDMLREAFPEASLGWELQASDTKVNQDAASLRLLLPRIKPAPTTKGAKEGEWTVAVIPSPNEEGQSALLEVAAANSKGWKVVDRKEVQTALGEARFANPWGKGEHRLAELGDRISADLLILVSRIEGKDLKILCFEAVDAATGLPVLREHMESKALSSEAAVGPLLARIRNAFAKARAGARPKAITMLPFAVNENVPNSSALSRLFTTAIHAEVDATPGLLSVGKNEIQTIANEQKLVGHDGLWAAAFTLEGGMAATPEGKVSLTLRLRPLGNESDKGIDVVEVGSAVGIAELAARTWAKLTMIHPFTDEGYSIAKPDQKQAKLEASRLLREGVWLVNSGSPAEALPLFERAELLGADSEELVTAHLNALARCINIKPTGFYLTDIGNWVVNHPLSPNFQLNICRELPDAQAMLDQTIYYFERYGLESFHWKHQPFHWKNPRIGKVETNVFMRSLTLLSYLRASIPKALPVGMSADAVLQYGESLDQFTANYFKIRLTMKNPTMSPDNAILKQCGPGTAAMIRRNPELLKGWVTMFFECSTHDMSGAFRIPHLAELLGDAYSAEISGITEPYGRTNLILDEIMQRMDSYTGTDRRLRESEIAFLLSTDDNRALAGKQYAAELAKLGRRTRFKQQGWLGRAVLRHYGPSILLNTGNLQMPNNGDELVVAMVHEPLGNMDWIAHPKYDKAILKTVELEENFSKHKESREYAWKYLDRLALEISKNREVWQGFESAQGAARLWESIYGQPLYNDLSKRWSGLYQPNGEGGNQNVLTARLLTDLRTVDNFKPGMFKLPTIDSTHRDRMWLYFQPFEENQVSLPGQPTSLRPLHPTRQPWMIGIDCVEGKISMAVNLALAPGFDSDRNNLQRDGFSGEEGFIVQTKDMILTTARWLSADRKSDFSEAAVLMRKEDGKFMALDTAMVIGNSPDVLRKGLGSVGAVAVGDEFFCLQRSGDLDAFYGNVLNNPFQLIRISSEGKVSNLSSYGRRPELTPFDPIDRFPRMILPDGNRLLVIRDSEHIGYFNPKESTWDMDARESANRWKTALNLTNNEYRSYIFPHCRLKVGNGSPDLIVNHDRTFPDMLSILVPGVGEKRIKVQLELPDGFSKQYVFGDFLYSNGKTGNIVGYATYESREGTNTYSLVVINQTKDDIILGLQVGSGLQWIPGKRINSFLPLVWALPKNELLQNAAK